MEYSFWFKKCSLDRYCFTNAVIINLNVYSGNANIFLFWENHKEKKKKMFIQIKNIWYYNVYDSTYLS